MSGSTKFVDVQKQILAAMKDNKKYICVDEAGEVKAHDVMTLKEINDYIGGYFEVMACTKRGKGYHMFVNEIARLAHLPVNAWATKYANKECYGNDIQVFGPVIFKNKAADAAETDDDE
jgi:hypothetical protein